MKIWTDKSVLEFIKIKRPLDGEGFPFLWSSNNSVAVDADFWRRLKLTPDHKDYGSSLTRHAREVYKLASECAYYDGTGEPGFVNVDMLVDKKEGLPTVIDGSYVGSPSYQMADDTRIYLAGLQRKALGKKYLMVPNPCGEQPLAIFGAYCVSGDTRILHRAGYDSIRDLVGKSIEAYNGHEWSTVTPFITGQDRNLVRVTTSDGSYLDCTPEHRFKIRGCRQGNSYSTKSASDLKPGDILPTFRVPEDLAGTPLPEAYTYGAFLGDGAITIRSDSDTPRYQIALYPGKLDLPVSGTRGAPQALNGGVRVTVSHLRQELLDELKEAALPNDIFLLDRPSTIDFIRGWIDTDGSADASGGITITTICEQRARGLQLLLRRAGASFASINKHADVGHVTNYGVRQHPLWRVYIPASEAGMFAGHRVQPSGVLDLAKMVKQARVVSVEAIEGGHTTYCFSEPELGMGVFGNMLTYQCTIADVVPFHADTLEEAEDAYKHAARALLRVNTMPSLYQAEVDRTNRIGVGSTGVHEFAWKFFKVGFRDLVNPDFEGYLEGAAHHTEVWDSHLTVAGQCGTTSDDGRIRAAAFWECFGQFSRSMVRDACHYAADVLKRNAPHTIPTDKPAGTTSKLFGLSEGKHLPAMAHYLRWVQFRDTDPLVPTYEAQGYPVRRNLKTYTGTVIVGFPTEPIVASLGMGDALVLAGDASPEDQYKWLQLNEFFWLEGGTVAEYLEGKGPRPGEDRYGSQISYTLKYKPNETSFEEFSEMMMKYQPTIRCCSVMPEINADDSVYEYLPEQPLTKVEFEASLKNIRLALAEDIGREHVECDNGFCPIDFNSTQ